MTEAKYCPFRSDHCDAQCAVWDSKESRCSLVSIAQCSRQLHELRLDLGWVQRSIDDLARNL